MGQGFNSPRLHHLSRRASSQRRAPGPLSAVNSPRELIAVYGSLLRAEGGLTAVGAWPFLEFTGTARLPGCLYDLGDFPGLRWNDRTSGLPGVPGELFTVLDQRALAILDDYEGCPGEHLPTAGSPIGFYRQRIRLLEPNVEAWVYLYGGGIGHCRLIAGAGWTEYKAGREASAKIPSDRR